MSTAAGIEQSWRTVGADSANKAIVLRFFDEVLTRGDLQAAETMVSPAIVVVGSDLLGLMRQIGAGTQG